MTRRPHASFAASESYRFWDIVTQWAAEKLQHEQVVARVLAKGVIRDGTLPVFLRASALKHLLAFAVLIGASAQADEGPLASLAWLSGCWAAENGEPGSGEQWMPLAGGTMLGVGRTVRNGRTVEHEFLQIRLNAEGKPVYIASPSGQREATFVASVLSPEAVTFENPQHDFPQRIMYRALPDGRLAARIEGLRGGALRGVDYPMKRVACGAAGK